MLSLKKITFAMVIITIVLSLGMSVFSSPLLANTDNSSINRVEQRQIFKYNDSKQTTIRYGKKNYQGQA